MEVQQLLLIPLLVITSILIESSAEDFMCYECDVRHQDCDIMNGRDIPQTACPGEKCLISEYHCNSTLISDDCQAEYDNAVQNGQLNYFYYRCATEPGALPLRTRCPLCCGEDLDCGTMRACAKDDITSMDELDAHIYVCETE